MWPQNPNLEVRPIVPYLVQPVSMCSSRDLMWSSPDLNRGVSMLYPFWKFNTETHKYKRIDIYKNEVSHTEEMSLLSSLSQKVTEQELQKASELSSE
jgi:hypothetical protein